MGGATYPLEGAGGAKLDREGCSLCVEEVTVEASVEG
jgi:hypothetical protein